MFPIESMRSLSRILFYREDGWRGLNSKMSKKFVKLAAEMIYSEVEKENIKQRFFQGSLLFLALLRFRIADRSFMNPDDSSYDARTFEEVEDSMRSAIEIVKKSNKYNDNQAEKIENNIEKIVDFMHMRGQSGIVADLAAIAGI